MTFQSQNEQPYFFLAEVYMMYVPSDSPLVLHLLTLTTSMAASLLNLDQIIQLKKEDV